MPERATITGFAVETNGVLVEGEFIEKRKPPRSTRPQSRAATRRRSSSGSTPRRYRARIFPVPAGGTRRVVLRYIELRPIVDGKLEYVYPMGAGEPVRIGEFSLSVDLGDAGTQMKIATLADARVEENGKRRHHAPLRLHAAAPFQLEAKLPGKPRAAHGRALLGRAATAPTTCWRATRPTSTGRKVKQQRADVVVVVDTSAAGDEAARQLKAAAAEAILRAL